MKIKNISSNNEEVFFPAHLVLNVGEEVEIDDELGKTLINRGNYVEVKKDGIKKR